MDVNYSYTTQDTPEFKSLFCGRLNDLTQLLGYISEGQSVALFGERRIGKTLLLWFLRDIINGDIQNYRHQLFDEQLAKNKYEFIVDLKNTDYVNSSGWGAFMRILKEMRDNNGDLVIVNMSQEVYLVYETMDLSTILKSFNTIEEALANFT